MASTFKGYDPDLGRKFSQESSGLVIGRARSVPKKSEAQVQQEWIEEHGQTPDAQQMHDAMLPGPTSSAPRRGTRESIQAILAKMTPAQRAELFDKLL